MTSMLTAILILALQHPSMPAGMSHEEHQKQMQKDADLKRRGEAAMGFDQDKTTHHFRTSASGGSIEVDVKDPKDTASLAQVRAHLQEIATAFANGNFASPMQTHAEVPPEVGDRLHLCRDVPRRRGENPHHEHGRPRRRPRVPAVPVARTSHAVSDPV